VGDASDADANVVRRQLAENGGTIRWRRIDASSGPEQVARHASAYLDEYRSSKLSRMVQASAIERWRAHGGGFPAAEDSFALD
jgi:hypothetical protein